MTTLTIAYKAKAIYSSQNRHNDFYRYTEEELFMVIVRFLASKPGVAFQLKDGGCFEYVDDSAGGDRERSTYGNKFRIEKHVLKL